MQKYLISMDSDCLCFQEYKAVFEGVGSGTGEKTLEDAFFEHEVKLLALKYKNECYSHGIIIKTRMRYQAFDSTLLLSIQEHGFLMAVNIWLNQNRRIYLLK